MRIRVWFPSWACRLRHPCPITEICWQAGQTRTISPGLPSASFHAINTITAVAKAASRSPLERCTVGRLRYLLNHSSIWKKSLTLPSHRSTFRDWPVNESHPPRLNDSLLINTIAEYFPIPGSYARYNRVVEVSHAYSRSTNRSPRQRSQPRHECALSPPARQTAARPRPHPGSRSYRTTKRFRANPSLEPPSGKPSSAPEHYSMRLRPHIRVSRAAACGIPGSTQEEPTRTRHPAHPPQVIGEAAPAACPNPSKTLIPRCRGCGSPRHYAPPLFGRRIVPISLR